MVMTWPPQDVPWLVNQIYRQVLERGVLDHNGSIMDASGLMTHGCQLMNGQASIRDVVRELAMSAEYASKCIDSVSMHDALEMCFERFLGRQIDEPARQHYGELYHHHHWSMRDIINDVINSQEYTSSFGDNGVPYRRAVLV
ncbi:phycobilisome rod-core linker polypeptide [Tengunoibacter tsumagoiensis]|uniref:PBS-linker domain-containing protein n=1 Tax=Tengunoibacter tsumagoiensis TaxID=2014871 RepID=A0A401ZUP9_9CHLR|nr:phycobilisome rod-core linker polypeptide [Tengunoibacter tsumagoiensis]GCE10557.1 hypothetical protein KTT_04160 [Tengunoibacter tsumagoiensis]